jgi:large subunit ribosomal protein L10
MAITREQKENIIEEGKKDLQESKVLLFTDYKGTNVDDIGALRKTLLQADAKMKVIKKRLLKIILKDSGIEISPTVMDGQVAAVFARGSMSDVAGPLYNFSKDHETFEILGGVDVDKKSELPRELIIQIGNLPPREVLLASVVGSIAAPIRGLMYVLSEKAKK